LAQTLFTGDEVDLDAGWPLRPVVSTRQAGEQPDAILRPIESTFSGAACGDGCDGWCDSCSRKPWMSDYAFDGFIEPVSNPI